MTTEIKRQIGGCQICGWAHEDDNIFSACLDFDHIDKKIFGIANLYSHQEKNS